MKPEIIEALALELTKARMKNKDSVYSDIQSAELWVETYQQAMEDIESEFKKSCKNNPPMTGGMTVFD
ncbi:MULTISPECIES: hypothetical protein [Acinetobacter]|uniref:Uncharacterized protein n=1 Tax=Acinetobacter piscicola TaxID=2006115 RepID=A0A7S6VVM4_9GAMM|nr:MULTISPECIES: hypothetical protein [Acinetobacter]QOW45749.1 hypothetical protein G0028_07495 [Acinetobacter piscicola]